MLLLSACIFNHPWNIPHKYEKMLRLCIELSRVKDTKFKVGDEY
jgi:hypothetical protein